MSEPIVEQIAVAIVAALNEIRVANGNWRQDIMAGRPKQVDFDNLANGVAPSSNGTCYVSQTEDGKAESEAENTYSRRQNFVISVFVQPPAALDVTPDTAINRVVSDVIKKLWENEGQIKNPDGTAVGWLTDMYSVSISRLPGTCAVEITQSITYMHKLNDPDKLG